MPIALALTRWLVFRVAASLVPICANAVFLWSRGRAATWFDVTGRGELLLLTVALSAAGIGELLSAEPRSAPRGPAALFFARVLKICRGTAGGAAFLLSMFGSMYFGNVSAAVLMSDKALQTANVVSTSKWIYGSSVVVSGVCVALATLGVRRT